MLSLSTVTGAGSWQQESDRLLPQLRQNTSTTCEANFGEEKCCIARSSVRYAVRRSLGLKKCRPMNTNVMSRLCWEAMRVNSITKILRVCAPDDQFLSFRNFFRTM